MKKGLRLVRVHLQIDDGNLQLSSRTTTENHLLAITRHRLDSSKMEAINCWNLNGPFIVHSHWEKRDLVVKGKLIVYLPFSSTTKSPRVHDPPIKPHVVMLAYGCCPCASDPWVTLSEHGMIMLIKCPLLTSSFIVPSSPQAGKENVLRTHVMCRKENANLSLESKDKLSECGLNFNFKNQYLNVQCRIVTIQFPPHMAGKERNQQVQKDMCRKS